MLKSILFRRFTTCLVIHPIKIKSTHRKIVADDIYAAEEAIGLAESLNWQNTVGPFTNYNFDSNTIFDESKCRLIDEKNMPEDLEINEQVNLLGTNAIYQGANYFELVFPSSENGQDDEDDDYQKYSFAQSHTVKIKTSSKMFYFPRQLLLSLRKFVALNEVEMLFVNDFLSPLQLRNIKKMIISESVDSETTENEAIDSVFINVVDRLGIILEIFNRRSRSEITKLQVALLYVKYAKTLFVKEEDHFTTLSDIYNFNVTQPEQIKVKLASAKQAGRNNALAGVGESQREMQNRIMKKLERNIQERIERAIENQKSGIQKSNSQSNLIIVALIGYTNAGKSAVMNLFANSEVVESRNMLFQTLATVSKKVKIRGNFEVMLVDTIGFISNLPIDLLPTFVSTLEHLKSADLILHIRDISHPQTENQNKIVLEIVEQVGISKSEMAVKMIEVRNKIDLLEQKNKNVEYLENESVVNISATSKINIERFRELLVQRIYKKLGCFEHIFRNDFATHDKRTVWLKEFV